MSSLFYVAQSVFEWKLYLEYWMEYQRYITRCDLCTSIYHDLFSSNRLEQGSFFSILHSYHDDKHHAYFMCSMWNRVSELWLNSLTVEMICRLCAFEYHSRLGMYEYCSNQCKNTLGSVSCVKCCQMNRNLSLAM